MASNQLLPLSRGQLSQTSKLMSLSSVNTRHCTCLSTHR